ncbi:MFS general substrate transporter, partial [Metschnikowia bicuspidata]
TLVIPTWFKKHLALAMGITVSGAGLGGLVFSFILNAIILATGDQKWALRVIGLINLVISLFASVFMRVRNRKPVNYKETLSGEFLWCALKVVFDIKIFNSYPLVIAALWFGVVLMGYVIILYSFVPYATSEGLSAKQAANILAVLNASQVVGRPSIGRIGDFLGRKNISFIICCYLSVLLLVFWLQATNYASIMVLAALIGAAAGVGSTMAQSMAHDILEFQGIAYKLPAAWGGMNIVVSLFVLPAEVIALKLKRGSGAGSYRNAQIFTSCAFFAGALLLLVNREWLVRQTLISRRFAALEAVKTKQSSYLRSVDLILDVEDGPETIEHRIEGYDRLLARTPLFFLVRAFYPIRV